jgi:hypothetical protein
MPAPPAGATPAFTAGVAPYFLISFIISLLNCVKEIIA